MARFRKVDPRIWNDEKFQTLTPLDKLLALYCLTAQCNRIGLFKFSVALAGEDLDIPINEITKGMARVCDTLTWRYDKGIRVLYFPTWWKYNGACGPKTMRGLLGDLHDIPQTPLLQEFMTNTQYLSLAEMQVLDTYAKGMPRVSAFGAQEQEQEKEQEQESK